MNAAGLKTLIDQISSLETRIQQINVMLRNNTEYKYKKEDKQDCKQARTKGLPTHMGRHLVTPASKPVVVLSKREQQKMNKRRGMAWYKGKQRFQNQLQRYMHSTSQQHHDTPFSERNIVEEAVVNIWLLRYTCNSKLFYTFPLTVIYVLHSLPCFRNNALKFSALDIIQRSIEMLLRSFHSLCLLSVISVSSFTGWCAEIAVYQFY